MDYKSIINYSNLANISEAELMSGRDTTKETKIILLSNLDEESYTVPEVEKECKARGMKFRMVDVNSCKLYLSEGSYIIDDKQKKPFKIHPNNTAVLTRRGVVKNTFTQDVVNTLELNNFFVVNTLNAVLKCENKYTTSKILENAGLLIPKMALLPDIDHLEEAVDAVGGSFPIVMKTLSGTQGLGVSIVDSIESLRSVLQTILKIDPTTEILIQEKIDGDYDIRIQVLNKWNNSERMQTESIILGAMRRNKIKNDFRTNYSLGGTVEKIQLTKEQEEIAIKAAKSINCTWCGVDIMVDKETGKNFIIEVNASPGTKGLKKATGINVVKTIIEYLSDKTNWIPQKNVIGFREWITVEGIGKMVAKFDTGNGSSASSMSAEDIDVDETNKKVKWKLGKKKFVSEFIGWSEPVESLDGTHKRPMIKMDITFNNNTVLDVVIGLRDRSAKSTKFLVNRKLMRQLGCSVDPTRDFELLPFEGGFDAQKARKEAYYGIIFEK